MCHSACPVTGRNKMQRSKEENYQILLASSVYLSMEISKALHIVSSVLGFLSPSTAALLCSSYTSYPLGVGGGLRPLGSEMQLDFPGREGQCGILSA